MFSRETIYDYSWPTLSTFGEQAVKNKEIYAQGSAADETTFGYDRQNKFPMFDGIVKGMEDLIKIATDALKTPVKADKELLRMREINKKLRQERGSLSDNNEKT